MPRVDLASTRARAVAAENAAVLVFAGLREDEDEDEVEVATEA